jgi:hypothetical protein
LARERPVGKLLRKLERAAGLSGIAFLWRRENVAFLATFECEGATRKPTLTGSEIKSSRPVTFEGENEQGCLSRRKRNWIAAVQFEATSQLGAP